MNLQLSPPHLRPLMIYDGECRFCRVWIVRWRYLIGGKIVYAPYQRMAGKFPQIVRQEFAAAVHLIEPDGEVYKGAEAVFRSLGRQPRWRWLAWCYCRAPGFAAASEAAYRWVARHRK